MNRTMRYGLAALTVAVGLATSPVQARGVLPPGRAPVRAAPAEPDPGCAAFGPGFRKLEGSDTCVKLGGAVRVEMGISTGGSSSEPRR